MIRHAVVILVVACGPQGSTDVQTSLFVEEPFLGIAAGAPVAVGTTVVACAGSERTRAAPHAALFPGGSLNERSTSHPTNVTIEAEPASRVRVSNEPGGGCARLTPLSPGEITVNFEGTIEGRESEASVSFLAAEAELKGEWVTTDEPLLAGELVTARVWAEQSGTRVVTALTDVELPDNAHREIDSDLRITLEFDAAPGALTDILGERRVLQRAESASSRLTDTPDGKALVVDLQVGERTLTIGEHEIRVPSGEHNVTIQTPERCTTSAEPGATDAPETSTHRGRIPLRARENAPEGPCELHIVTTHFGQTYEQDASVELSDS